MRISTINNHLQGLSELISQESRLTDIRNQLSSGKRIRSGSDDPANASRVLNLKQKVASIEQYDKNIAVAELRLSFSDVALDNVSNIMTRFRELTIQGNNSTLTLSERRDIASVIEHMRDELVELANFKTADGNYLYAGYQNQQPPFVTKSNGEVVYNGDYGVRSIQIGEGITIQDGDTGEAIFQNIKAASGSYKTVSDSTNTGTGVISQGIITDSEQWQASLPEEYIISFNALNPGANFDVYAKSAPGVPLAGFDDVNFTSGDTITVAGVEMSITGAPQPGDTFTLKPTSHQSVFTSMSRVIDMFNTANLTETDQKNLEYEVGLALENIDSAEGIIFSKRSQVGARMSTLDNQRDVNSNFNLLTIETLSSIEDIDYIEAIANYDLQTFTYQTAQQAFARIQNLSLFNYI